MRYFTGHVVVVGTIGDPNKGAGLHVHGNFDSLAEANAFAEKVQEAFDAVSKQHDRATAFPYGEPYVEVVPMNVGATPVDAVDNWVYDPNFEED